MVVTSEDVRNVLNRIYLVGIAYNGKPPKIYFDCIEAIENLDKSIENVYAKSLQNVPFAWKRDNMLVCKVGKYCFSYVKFNIGDEIIISVEEVAENGIIITENKNNNIMKNTKNTIRLTESQLHTFIKECVKRVLNEVTLGGESLHGYSPKDWNAMKVVRRGVSNAYGENDDDENYFKHLHKAARDVKNQADLFDAEFSDYAHGKDFIFPNHSEYERFINRGDIVDKIGNAKGMRIRKNLNIPNY